MKTRMTQPITHYDRDCLQRLLEDALPEPLAGEVAEHVADCAECRQQLDALAGKPQWWLQACSGVKEILADYLADQTKQLALSHLELQSIKRPG